MSKLGQRVREIREDFGFEVGELAEMAGIDARRLSDAEAAGDFSTWELAQVASCLAVSPSDLLSGDVPNVKRSTARFRAPTGLEVPTAHDVRLLARGQQVGRIFAFLERLLGDPVSPIVSARRVLPIDGDSEPWKQGYFLGARAREKLGVTRGPIDSMQALLESLGVHVASVAFDSDGIEAASLFEPGAAPVILLNSRASRVVHRYARRAILAHELCHLLHDGGENDLVTIVSRDADGSPVEQRAGGFAPSFIAPGAELELRETTLPESIVELGETWGLSFEGAVWHAKNLKRIEADEAKHLLQRRPKPTMDLRFEETAPHRNLSHLGIDQTPSSLVAGLFSDTVGRALEAELISIGRATELIEMS